MSCESEPRPDPMCWEIQRMEKAGIWNRARSQRCLRGDPKGEREEGIGFAATSCPKKNNCRREAGETERGKVQEAEVEGGGYVLMLLNLLHLCCSSRCCHALSVPFTS